MRKESFVKEKSYYEDRYDLYTIKLCLQTLQPETDVPLPNQDLMPNDAVISIKDNFAELINYFKSGERYRNRRKTIEKWIAEDQNKQDYYDKTLDPSPVLCSECFKVMRLFDKDLIDFLDKPIRVLFLFECPNCKSRKGLYDNGDEYESDSKNCPKCKSKLSSKTTRNTDEISIVTNCTKCDYKDTYNLNLKVDNTKHEKEEFENKKLLEMYREKYCLSSEAGEEYIIHTNRTKDYLFCT